jgi:predicted regulator of Ras-like GTPase activity (Roadblock/LC7/MglB family)
MSAEFDALVQQVQQNQSVEGSAVTLIQGIAAQLAGDPSPQQVSALASQLKSSADALAAAVAANTQSQGPSAPTPVS